MMTLQHELNKLKQDTLDGLEQSQKALTMLREKCRESAELLATDLAAGAAAVAEVAPLIYDFVTFEQEVVDIFAINAESIEAESDNLAHAEKDMKNLLASFDEKMDAMDILGVAELFRKAMPALLMRFQILLPELRKCVCDFIKNGR